MGARWRVVVSCTLSPHEAGIVDPDIVATRLGRYRSASMFSVFVWAAR